MSVQWSFCISHAEYQYLVQAPYYVINLKVSFTNTVIANSAFTQLGYNATIGFDNYSS